MGKSGNNFCFLPFAWEMKIASYYSLISPNDKPIIFILHQGYLEFIQTKSTKAVCVSFAFVVKQYNTAFISITKYEQL